MKKILKCFLIILFSFLFISNVNAKEVTMYFFYGSGCPHCAAEEKFLEELEDKYDELTIKRYEVWYDTDNQQKMYDMINDLNINVKGVPLTIVGKNYVSGYAKSYNSKIEQMIENELGEVNSNTEKETEKDKEKDNKNIYELPLLGKVDVKKVSLPIISIAIGLVDGFNPCAMWILLFLISMLIGMKDKRRMWILGTSFILTSALFYMLMMMSWLEIVVNINTSIIMRNIIAGIAIIGSFINIRTYIKTRKTDGCVVVNEKKRRKTFDKIKKFTSEKSLFLALIGIIGLAISVNFIELACSAGLPLIFTQILALNNVSRVGAFLYTSLYILFFMLDDLIIFIIAMITLRITGISTKYTKYSHLIGGILMLIIGLLLIFKPEWIMFNFV